MQIYFIENENPKRNSSSGHMTYIINLCDSLNNAGIKNVLVGSGKGNKDKINNLAVTPIQNFISISSKEISNLIFFLKLLYSRRRIKSNNHCIYHFHHPYMAWPLIPFRKNIVLALTIHGRQNLLVHYKRGKLYNWLYNSINNYSLKYYDLIISVDEGSKSYYENICPKISGKIKIIPTGVNLEKFYPMDKSIIRDKYGFKSDEKIVIFVGRLEFQKRLDFLIKSCNLAKDSIEKLKLILIGKGSEREYLKKLASHIGFNNIEFFGEVNNESISELLNCADIFALTSRWEGSPTVIKEALACNIPVVSVDVGDVKEVIEEIDGCFIAENDPGSFADMIKKVFNSKDKIDARRKIMFYSHHNMGDRVIEIYKKTLSKKLNIVV